MLLKLHLILLPGLPSPPVHLHPPLFHTQIIVLQIKFLFQSLFQSQKNFQPLVQSRKTTSPLFLVPFTPRALSTDSRLLQLPLISLVRQTLRTWNCFQSNCLNLHPLASSSHCLLRHSICLFRVVFHRTLSRFCRLLFLSESQPLP